DRLRPAKGAELHQEAFHYDPATKRFRQLTATDGRVFAVARTPNGKWATALTVEGAQAGDAFHGAKVLFVELANPGVHGPLALKGSPGEVTLGVNNFGEPEVVVDESGTRARYVLDSARTGLAGVDVEPVGASVVATPKEVSCTAEKSTDGVTLADGAS